MMTRAERTQDEGVPSQICARARERSQNKLSFVRQRGPESRSRSRNNVHCWQGTSLELGSQTRQTLGCEERGSGSGSRDDCLLLVGAGPREQPEGRVAPRGQQASDHDLVLGRRLA
eukprot:1489103-Rhodomonas_salina.1